VPLAHAIRARWPEYPLLLTVSTPTGNSLARAKLPAPVAWFPLDHPLTVRRFLDKLRPRALLLVETELWPTVLSGAHARRIPVALVSGRLSESHARAYHRVAPVWRAVIRPIAVAAMQNDSYADRLAALGVERSRIHVTGNIKYDAIPAASSEADRATLRARLGIPPNAPVLVFGSTRERDEALAARCIDALRQRFPDLLTIIAPRHLDRVDAVRQAMSGVPHVLRSELRTAVPTDTPAILLDTHGELLGVYGLATVAVVCGSFYPGVEGHNPIEPAAQGVATVFGPHMRNFADIAADLLVKGGAVQTKSADDLPGTLAALLRDLECRERIARAGREAVLANAGAIQRALNAIAPAVDATERW